MATVIAGVRVWDGTSETLDPSISAVRVEGTRIEALGAESALAGGAELLRFDGATLIPGLIDAHVHLTLDPSIAKPAAQDEVPRETRMTGMRERARAMVRAGITTARDLGGGEGLELELRDQIARGETPGPRLLCAGQPVTSRRGHCHFWGGEAEGPDQICEVVRRQVRSGADWIKVMATGGVLTRGTETTKPQFSLEELEVLVREARSHDRAVAAHCHGTAGISLAARAGVRTVEHCSFAGAKGFGDDLDLDVVADLARDDLWISPTINSGWGRFEEKDGKPTGFFTRMQACQRALRRAGARLIASTDAGIPGVAHDRLPHALGVFARYAELSPVEALRTATSTAALALGLVGETGAIRAGLAADLLVTDGDPTRDLSALERPLLVIARGAMVTRGTGVTSST